MAEEQICRDCYFWDGFPASIEALCDLRDEGVKRFDETCTEWRSNKRELSLHNTSNPVREAEPADSVWMAPGGISLPE